MSNETQRLFFALWPDVALQRALHRFGRRLHELYGGRVVRLDTIHLTLAFLGSVAVDRIDELHALGGAIRGQRFTLELSQAGCWKRAAVAWVGPSVVPQALEELALEMRGQLLRAAFPVDEKPFAAHVTLLRKAKCRPNDDDAIEPLAWPVSHFCLVRSETLPTGPVYTEIARWQLA